MNVGGAEDDLELLNLPPLPPKCWVYRPAPPYLLYAVLRLELGALCLGSKLSANSVTSTACGKYQEVNCSAHETFFTGMRYTYSFYI